jgi:hypothetical protein
MIFTSFLQDAARWCRNRFNRGEPVANSSAADGSSGRVDFGAFPRDVDRPPPSTRRVSQVESSATRGERPSPTGPRMTATLPPYTRTSKNPG